MQIGIIYHKFAQGGGQENYMFGLVNALLDAGHEVHVLAARRGCDSLPVIFHEVPCIYRIHALRLNTFAKNSELLAAKLKLDATIGLGKTYAHDFHRAGGGVHKIYVRELSPWKRNLPQNSVALKLEEKLYTSGLTRHFVTNSNLIAGQIQHEYGVPMEKITTIYSAVDSKRYFPLKDSSEKEEIRRKYDTPLSGKVLLFISLDHERKGLKPLLKAIRNLDVVLWIAGVPLSGKHQQLVNELNLAPRIRHLGRVQDLAPVYRSADIFVSPSRYDAFANTGLESQACGLPGILSCRDGASEIIKEGENGWILHNPEDEKEIESKILHALKLTDPQYQKFSETAHLIASNFTWKRHVEKWVDLIHQHPRPVLT